MKKFLTIRQFAEATYYCERSVRQMCIDGKLEALKIGSARKWLIYSSELDDFDPHKNEGLRESSETRVNTDWVATVGINVEETLESWPAIPHFRGQLGGYAYLCDWFEKDLHKRLKKSGLNDWQITEDARDGETFSIRFRFRWLSTENPPNFGVLDWWEVLELAPLEQIYP